MSQVISVSFPENILQEAQQFIPRQKRSRAIVEAFSLYLKLLKRKQIERSQEEMYSSLSSKDWEECYEMDTYTALDTLETLEKTLS